VEDGGVTCECDREIVASIVVEECEKEIKGSKCFRRLLKEEVSERVRRRSERVRLRKMAMGFEVSEGWKLMRGTKLGVDEIRKGGGCERLIKTLAARTPLNTSTPGSFKGNTREIDIIGPSLTT